MTENKNIPQNFTELLKEIKEYISLQKEYTRLELTEKLTVLLSSLIFILIALILSMVALFFFSFAFAYVIAPYVGGLKISFAIFGGLSFVLIGVAYMTRKRLIIDPMTRFLANLFLNDNAK